MGAIRKIEYKHNYIAEILNSNTFDIAYNDKLEEFYAYLNMLHANISECEFLSFFIKKKEEYARWGISYNDWDKLYKLLGNDKDIYCSVNSFYKASECTSKNVKRLNALIVDLDYYKIPEYQGLTATQMIELLKMDVDYLEPSFYVDSGRGLYLIWLLENTYATTKSKSFWSKIELELIDKFKKFGADEKVKDVARVLRVPGSINTKSGREVKIILPTNETRTIYEYIYEPVRFELSDIANYYWGDIEEKEKPKIKTKVKPRKRKKLVALKTIKNLHYTRSEDLKQLVRIRESLEGCRENLLFLYRLNLLYADTEPNKALELTLKLNRMMNDPLSESEVERATRSAETNSQVYFRLKNKYDANNEVIPINKYLSQNGVYLYKNSTIIEELKITEDEMIHMDTLINANEKERRKLIKNKEFYELNKEYFKEYNKEYYKENKEYHKNRYEENKDKILNKAKNKYEEDRKSKGELSRNEKNKILREKIKSLTEEGFTQRDVSIQLGIGVSTVNRHLKSIREVTK